MVASLAVLRPPAPPADSSQHHDGEQHQPRRPAGHLRRARRTHAEQVADPLRDRVAGHVADEHDQQGGHGGGEDEHAVLPAGGIRSSVRLRRAVRHRAARPDRKAPDGCRPQPARPGIQPAPEIHPAPPIDVHSPVAEKAHDIALARKDIIRIATAGSVDDGKSTLIGRLLYDSKAVFEDQYEAVERASKGDYVDLALLTDGLRAEREQGITIDVAYRYFSTPRRTFILADTPGHVQYTRNMVTGASTADLAIVLVDARKGMLEQSRRHAFLASLLRVPHLVVAVNKMDLVDWSEEVYEAIRDEFTAFAAKLERPRPDRRPRSRP